MLIKLSDFLIWPSITILTAVILYVAVRLLMFAIFRSYFENKMKFYEEEEQKRKEKNNAIR
jgi:hypothetical protein